MVFLKTNISTEHSILKISALGLLAQSVRLLSFFTDFTIHEIVISIVHQPSVLLQPRLEMCSFFGTRRNYLCCRLCQMYAKTGWPSQWWVAENVNDQLLIKGSKVDDPPPLSSGPSPTLFQQSLKKQCSYIEKLCFKVSCLCSVFCRKII